MSLSLSIPSKDLRQNHRGRLEILFDALLTNRLLLSLLVKNSARQANATKLSTNLLHQGEGATLEVHYKDGKKLEVETSGMRIKQLVEMINSHSKQLELKEQAA